MHFCAVCFDLPVEHVRNEPFRSSKAKTTIHLMACFVGQKAVPARYEAGMFECLALLLRMATLGRRLRGAKEETRALFVRLCFCLSCVHP